MMQSDRSLRNVARENGDCRFLGDGKIGRYPLRFLPPARERDPTVRQISMFLRIGWAKLSVAMRLFPAERGHWASTVELRVEQN